MRKKVINVYKNKVTKIKDIEFSKEFDYNITRMSLSNLIEIINISKKKKR